MLHNTKLLASVITKSQIFFRVANGGFMSFVTLCDPEQRPFRKHVNW